MLLLQVPRCSTVYHHRWCWSSYYSSLVSCTGIREWFWCRGLMDWKGRKRPNPAGKILIVLNGNSYLCIYVYLIFVYMYILFMYNQSSLGLFFNFQRYTLRITNDTQVKQNNLLQILSQDFATFYPTMHDFSFQPIFTYLKICENLLNLYSIKSKCFFNPVIICNLKTHSVWPDPLCYSEL